ncbi:ArdC-like ssDNA-binding domain-containing protein [Oceanobacillus luteolus]|uniref:ArdC-like ssDNA-binding domain-containing protein n=1 Tax=Oceanobacillus luteolus TaxID=1274358 RepID=A0ABW4HSZ4_9BACI
MQKKKRKCKGPTQKERVQELLDILEDGVLNFLPDPEKFKAILEMKALMPNYSLRNIIIAKGQLPHARFLAGYKRWNELGRYVRKGEEAIRILAPRIKKVKNEETGEEENKKIGYIPVAVFDYSQTEGEPLPIDKIKIELEGDSPEARAIISIAEQIAEQDDCPIYYGDTGTANGFYRPFFHDITVSDKLSVNHRCKTLVHELVHSKVDRFGSIERSSKEKEVVAEGSAFIVCSYFGLDTSDYSFEYVKGWGNEDNPVMRYAERIFETSSSIIKEFEDLMVAKTEADEECVA